MPKELEQVLKKKVKFIVDEHMHKFLGVTVDELNKEISDKLSSKFLDFKVDTSIKFKIAKRMFKKWFLSKLIKDCYGNISEVARVTGLDRRSVHRAIHDLDIKIKNVRRNLYSPKYYRKEAVDNILKRTLEGYKSVIHPVKLKKAYSDMGFLSQDIVNELPINRMTLKEAEMEFEREYLRKALSESNNNLSETAKKIGIRYETLVRKMKKLNV